VYLAAGSAERELATTFLRWFLPQILFYGLGATIGAILNVRRSFAAPMFAPVLNNLVVIAICVAFVLLLKPRPPTVGTVTGAQTTLLAIGTTAGVVVMTLALLPSLAKVGFRYRPRLDLRNPRLTTALRLAGWTFLFVAVSQAGYLVVVRLSTGATAYTVYSYGYIIFQLPYAIIAVSVITALLPRMSSHAADNRPDLVRADLAEGMRMSMAAIVPAALFLLALGRPVAVTVFQHGAVSMSDAVRIGDAISAFAVALVPFSLFQLQLRAFYAHQDSRTPALTNVAVVASNVGAALVLVALVPAEHRAVALALAFCFAYTIGVVVASTLLRRRLGGLDGHRTLRLMTRAALAAGIGAVLAAALAAAVRSLVGDGWIGSGFAIAVAGGLGGWLFAVLAGRMHITEFTTLTASVLGRLGRLGRHGMLGMLGRAGRRPRTRGRD
jgi:putative peptidoglycan lipid II flippase